MAPQHSSGRIVRWNYDNTGLECDIFGYPTTRWTNKVSKMCGVQLDCQAHIDVNQDAMATGAGSAGLG